MLALQSNIFSLSIEGGDWDGEGVCHICREGEKRNYNFSIISGLYS